MKRILLALALLWASPAFAQPEILRPVSTAVVGPILFASAITSTAFNSQTRIARMMCTVSCLVAISVTPIILATTTPAPLAANLPEYFTVSPGQHVVVRSAGGAAGGTLYITEMTK
jgi:hypothetical protein